MLEISTKELQEKLENGENLHVVDVRRDEEVAEGKIPEAVHIELDTIPDRLDELNKDETHYLVCRSGGRSSRVAEFLEARGYKVVNVSGGMLAWEGKTEAGK